MNLFKQFFIFIYFFFISTLVLNTFNKSVDKFFLPTDMVYIPGDAYLLLFKEKGNIIRHEVSYFFVDKYPITNEKYLNFLRLNKKWEPRLIISFFSNKDYLTNWFLNENFFLIYENPVVGIPWYSALAYCKMFNKRLPTIDEWEYMSSVADKSYVGISSPQYIQKILNWYINSIGKNRYSIKTMFGNYWNIFGLHGIIWEWVYDFNSIIGLKSENTNNIEQLLFCGAATENSINPIDYVGFMRFAFRNSLDSIFSISSLGFRCVR